MEKIELKQNFLRVTLVNLFLKFLVLLLLILFLIRLDFILESFSKETYLIPNITYVIYGVVFLMLLINIFMIINTVFKAKTTKYIICENLVSRRTKQLNEIREDIPIKQITNINYSISWFLDKIFKTGSISIYTSGSSGADLVLDGINQVKEIYESIRDNIDKFRKDIISKKNSKLVKKIKPNIFAAILKEISNKVSLIIFVFVYLLFMNLENRGENLVLIFSLIIISIIFIVSIIIFVEFKKKKYLFYTDKLEYFDGFLTNHKVTVPYERVTDINIIRTIFDRILGVSTILVETAGSFGSEITIKYVNDGEIIVSELKELLKENGRN